MSKTGDLIEKYVLEELKIQVAHSNTNPYLAMYGVIIGAIFLHIGEIYSSFRTMKNTQPMWFYVSFSFLFFISLVFSIITFIFQCSQPKMPGIESFSPNRDAIVYEAEERAILSVNYKDYVLIENVDSFISEIVKIRLIHRINIIISEYQEHNRRKHFLQRLTSFLLLISIITGGAAIVDSMKNTSVKTTSAPVAVAPANSPATPDNPPVPQTPQLPRSPAHTTGSSAHSD